MSAMLSPAVIDGEQEAIQHELEQIAERNNGYLSPALVVEAAKDPANPLHDRFLWDDTEAARRFRLVQAGMLLRRIKVVVMRPALDSEPSVPRTVKVIRGTQSNPQRRGKGCASFALTARIMADAEARQALVQDVIKELRAIRQRYQEITELASVWAAIDTLSN